MINEQKRSIAISIRISPEELKMLENLTEVKHQTKTAVIISALTMYAQSLTAADTAPREVSPETVTGAEKTHTETETETPEEDQPQPTTTPTTPTTTTAGATETHPDERQDGGPDYIGKAGEDAQRAAERENTHTAARTYTREELEEIAGRIAERAARKAYQRAVQEERARATARRVRATARRVNAAGKIPAKIGKG